MKKLISSLMLLTMVFSFYSCQQDDDEIFNRLVGDYSWVGDLDFTDGVGVRLESGLIFGSDGFGKDAQCYFDRDFCLDAKMFSYEINDANLLINYGRQAAKREIRNIFIGKTQLIGDLYIEGRYVRDITLHKERL